VETEEQLEALKHLGCQRGQGYLLARPMTAAAVARRLESAAGQLRAVAGNPAD